METIRNPVQLHVLHNLGGGIERWCRDYCEADQERTNLILKPFKDAGRHGAGLMLYKSIDDAEPTGFWFFDAPFDAVVETHLEYRKAIQTIVGECGVDGIVVSSLVGHSLDILDTGLPTLVVTHDYFPVCPAIYAYFNAPCTECGDERCMECQQHNPLPFNPFPAFLPLDRLIVRRRYLDLLAGNCVAVVSPTRFAQSNWRRLAVPPDGIRFHVVPHGLGRVFTPIQYRLHKTVGERLSILVLGDLSEHKGLRLLMDGFSSLTAIADLYLVGSGVAGRLFPTDDNVTVVESYSIQELPAILESIKPDCALLLSVCPETFSYTLSELASLGVPVVATRTGSFLERIVDGETGFLINPDAGALIETLKSIFSAPSRLDRVHDNLLQMQQRFSQEMVRDYQAVMPLIAQHSTVLPIADKQANWQLWSRRLAAKLIRLSKDNEQLRQGAEILDAGAAELSNQIRWLRNELALREQKLIEMYDLFEAGKSHINKQLAAKDEELNIVNQQLAAVSQQLVVVLKSTSWKVTRPMRFIALILRGDKQAVLAGLHYHLPRMGKWLYWRLPVTWRPHLVGLAYRVAGPVFRGMNDYERWRLRGYGSATALTAQQNRMVAIESVPPLQNESPGRIAIHVHIFYADLAIEFAGHLRSMPYVFDLFISVPDIPTQRMCEGVFGSIPKLGELSVVVVPNRGRDIAPLLCEFGGRLRDYDFIAHLHSKKSLYNEGRTSGWREYLLNNLFASPEHIKRIFALLSGPDHIGLVYPQTYAGAPYLAHTWLANRPQGLAWCARLGISPPPGYFDFPVGSMFWARTDAIRPLLESGIGLEGFPPEQGQTDGTLAHMLERMLGLLPGRQGYSLAILRDRDEPSWSRWRMDRPLLRTLETVVRQVAAPEIQVAAFDIFDTLLLRPLLDPEQVKQIVARRMGGEWGDYYLAERHRVEESARRKAGTDVNLDAIYQEWKSTGSFTDEQLLSLLALEEAVEIASVRARPGAVELLGRTRSAGKRVVLASDMYLSKAVIETMLAKNGISGWDRLYLSNEIGLRKDSGALYRHLLIEEAVPAGAAIMVGDNERSDFQIPNDLGMAFCHLLRPVEIARALPRWQPLLESWESADNLDASVGLGLVLRHCFGDVDTSKIQPEAFAANAKAIGYAVLGPVALAFAAWLGRQAEVDNVEQLYFLSREGAILKCVYDRWREATGEGVPSVYLVLSRRSVTVPMLESLEDIYKLAEARFFPNDPAMFLRERYGLTLDAGQWDEIDRRGLWERGKLLEIRGNNIEHIKPLLNHLQPVIMERAATEKPALMAYLASMGLAEATSRAAVVDVGYSGTIQARLIRLLGRPVDGYYLITNTTAGGMSRVHNVKARGCFGEGLVPDSRELGLYRQSFELEKLLSSDESQIVHYRLEGETAHGSEVRPVYRENCEVLQGTEAIRADIQAGLLQFVEEAMRVRKDLLPDFVFPIELASALFDAFVTEQSAAEATVLKAIVLDDYYCGRGLVS